jgi:hypothetical protein
MMKAEVTGNAIEFSFSAGEALLLGISALFVVVLTVLAGWQVAFVALGLSLFGAGAVDAVQRADVKILGR